MWNIIYEIIIDLKFWILFYKFYNFLLILFVMLYYTSIKTLQLTINNWPVAGVPSVTVLMALADWTCPMTTMFMDTFSAPIFVFAVVFRLKKTIMKNDEKWLILYFSITLFLVCKYIIIYHTYQIIIVYCRNCTRYYVGINRSQVFLYYVCCAWRDFLTMNATF